MHVGKVYRPGLSSCRLITGHACRIGQEACCAFAPHGHEHGHGGNWERRDEYVYRFTDGRTGEHGCLSVLQQRDVWGLLGRLEGAGSPQGLEAFE